MYNLLFFSRQVDNSRLFNTNRRGNYENGRRRFTVLTDDDYDNKPTKTDIKIQTNVPNEEFNQLSIKEEPLYVTIFIILTCLYTYT